jgi:hypothetical protein
MTLLSDQYDAMRRPKSWRRVLRTAIAIEPLTWTISSLAVLALFAAIATAAPQSVIIEEIFSPTMFWADDGSMIVLEGVSYAADDLEGDEDRYVCEILADEFEGRVASLKVESVASGPDHDYLNAWVRVGKKDMNRRAEEIIAEVIGERDEEEGSVSVFVLELDGDHSPASFFSQSQRGTSIFSGWALLGRSLIWLLGSQYSFLSISIPSANRSTFRRMDRVRSWSMKL